MSLTEQNASMRTPPTAVSRRSLLKITSAAGGGLLFGFLLPGAGAVRADATATDTFAPDAFIRIDRSNVVTLIMPQVEMGQGIYTTLAMIVAEELDVDLPAMKVEAAPPNDALYANPALKFQITGGSTSVRAFWMTMRKAGADARDVLVQAAAKRWNVAPETCRTENGSVVHDPSGQRGTYGSLIDDTTGLKPGADVPLKDPAKFRLIGTPAKRLDTPDKVNGKAVYGIDVVPPGVKVATLASCPVFGGRVAHVDQKAAMAVPGVRQVVVLDDLVAVVGDHMWAAKQGLAALDVEWDEGANAGVNSAGIWASLRDVAKTPGVVAATTGDPAIVAEGDGVIEQSYELPFLAHASLEPMNCTVHVQPDSCEVWVGNQVLTRAQAIAAKESGVPIERVTVHNHLIGGGFGRRLEVDGIGLAVRIAKQVEGPVKVVWTREEDIQHDMYRPIYHNRLAARLKDGKPVAWRHQVTASSIMARFAPPAFRNGIDTDAIEGAVEIPYDIANRTVRYARHEPEAVPTAFWRGVGPNNNIFAVESFMDRLAKAADRDPVDFRRDLLGKQPRALAVLETATKAAGWKETLPPRSGRGVSLQSVFGSFVATVAQVRVGDDGRVKVERLTCAVDCGTIVNPDTVVAQIQGGLIFGLTAAMYGNITIEGGRVEQSNFNDYRMLRINETPQIDVHLVRNAEAPGGIGEPGTVSVQAAVNNAIYAATGIQLDRMPVDPERLRQRSAS